MRILSLHLLLSLFIGSTALATTVYTVDQPVTTQTRSWTYSVAHAGDYQIGMAWIEVSSGSNVVVEVFTNGTNRVKALYAPAGKVTRFEMRLEDLNAGDTITVKVSPNHGTYRAGYKIAFGTPTFDGLPVFNVASYGAVGNGTTDDFAAIQNTVSAAINAGGGIVRFDGTKIYRTIGSTSLTSEVLINLSGSSNIKIEGNGATVVLFPPDMFASIENAENIQVDGFTVDYDPIPYYQGTITDINVANMTIDITVPDRYPVPVTGVVESPGSTVNGRGPFFGRYFIPDAPGARSGRGENIYIESTTTNGGPRQIRIKVPDTINGTPMQPRVQGAYDNNATEFVVPHYLYGHRNSTTRIYSSSRIKLSNLHYTCMSLFWLTITQNHGPITLSNVDLKIPNPATELLASWRDGMHTKNGRWGILIEDGDWDGASFYDDLFALYSRRQVVVSVSGSVATLKPSFEGKEIWLWQPGDWASFWSPDQGILRGMGRVISVTDAADPNYLVTLESIPPGVTVNDIVLHEESLNRNTVIRNCTTTSVGTKHGSTRFRGTNLHLLNNHFEDFSFLLEWDDSLGTPRARDVVVENTYFSLLNGSQRISRSLGVLLKNCTIDNTLTYCNAGAENVYFDNVAWTNFTGNILNLQSSSVWVFGGSSRNGVSSGLSSYVTKDGSSTISYSTPSGYPPAEPPLVGGITPPPAPTLTAVAGPGKVTLDWTNSLGASTYAVYRSETAQGPYSYLVRIIGTTHIDVDVEIGQTYYYVVAATDGNGNESTYSNEASATPTGIRLLPVADAYVNGGSYANTNYGSSVVLRCKTDPGNASYTRQSYLRFDLSSVSGTVFTATLRLKVASATGTGNIHTAYFVNNDTWAESSITWNNKPSAGAAIDAASFPAPGSWLELDMTDQTINESGGDKLLSMVLISDGTQLVEYNSRQAAEGNRPELVITTTDSAIPSPVTGVTAETAAGTLKISLSWEDQGDLGVSVYGVYRSTTPGGPYRLLVNTPFIGYVDTDIEFGTTYYYVITAVSDGGYSSGYSSEVSAMANARVLLPVADTFVQGGSYATTNYGGNTVLECKTDVSNDSYTRQSYLRFDLSSLTETINSAVLRLKVSSTTGTGNTHTAYFVSNDTWDESALVWNNKPAGSTLLDLAIHPGAADMWLQLDLTDQVQIEQAGDKLFSTSLISNGTVLVRYYSREAATGSQPELVIKTDFADTVAPAAPTGLTAATGDTLVHLDWSNNAEPDMASYTVYRSTAAQGPYTLLQENVFASEYMDNAVTNGQTYYYVITATDTAGNESLYSSDISAIPQVKPVTHWKFDDGSGTVAFDSSGNGNNGTITGGPSWVSGRDNGALLFDGVNDIVVKFLTETVWPKYSVALWVKAASLSQSNFSGVFNNNSAGADFQIDIDGTTPGNYRYKGATEIIIGAVSTDWVHLAVSCDGTNTSFYYNGSPGSTVTEARNVFGLFGVGFDRTNTGHFHGIIDDVRIYDSALSQAQVSNLYGSYFYKGDLNRSGRVDLEDIAELGRLWQDGYDMNNLFDIATDWLLDQEL